MSSAAQQLRLHRILLVSAGAAYLVWWLFVHAALPTAFNPFSSRAAVVVVCFLVCAASYASKIIARNLDTCLALCCGLATTHYFYLFDRNNGDLNWVVGSYITVSAVCAVLQTSRSLLLYSAFVTALSGVLLSRQSSTAYVVFLPGMLTNLIFANVGLFSRLRLTGRLQESNERIESLFDAGFDGIAVHEQGIIRQVNGVLGPLVGRSRAELIGKELTSLFVPEARELAAEMIAGRREASYETDVLRKDGTRVTVEVIGKQHNLNGVKMQQVAFRDLTERKRAEGALLRANRELESFSYSVAHDLRSPLRAVAGFSQILQADYADRLDEEGKHHLTNIASGAQQMAGLIDALLGLARLTRADVQRESVDLTKEVTTIVKQLRMLHPARNVELELVNKESVVAQGDAQLLHSLMSNLIGNAWKFTERTESARITFGIKTEKDDGGGGGSVTVYFVKDNGAGFDMSHMAKLFAPFQRLHPTNQYPGTGIGLATVQRIVERHGGRVWAEGVVDEGATFYFTLAPGV